MDRNRAVRGFLGVIVVVALFTTAPSGEVGRAQAGQPVPLAHLVPVVATADAATARHGSLAHTGAVVSPGGEAAATCTPGSKACPIRITFASGAYSGQAHSRLSGVHAERWFVVGARAGQSMIVLVKGAGPTRGIVYAPNGPSSGQPGGRVYDAVLPASGDYRIRVTESSMGEGWSGGIDVIVVIY